MAECRNAGLGNTLVELLSAAFSGVWIQTFDVFEAARVVVNVGKTLGDDNEEAPLAYWDCDRGFLQWDYGAKNGAGAFVQPSMEVTEPGAGTVSKPTAVLDLVKGFEMFQALADARCDGQIAPNVPALFVIKNPHFVPPQTSARVLQLLENEAVAGREMRRYVVCVSTREEIPPEIKRSYTLVTHPLPDRERLRKTLELIELSDEEKPTDEEWPAILDACAGMTPVEAGNAASLSFVRQEKIIPSDIWELKSQILKAAKGLSLWRGRESFGRLGGMHALKRFCLRSITNSRADTVEMQAKGVLLLGVPGSGKSAFAKALGRETQRPTLRLDIGSLMGQFVGQTEANTRDVIQVIDAMAPCILMVDEVEKALASGDQSHEVSQRMMGTWLSWLQDHESDVFTICTCNNIHKITGPHPEFARIGRFDGIFFVDLPTEQERDVIWQIYLDRYKKYEVDPEQPRPKDASWTGAEIEGCVKLAALHEISLTDAAANIIPVADVSETVSSLRDWAKDRCLSATHSGRYQGPEHLQEQVAKMPFTSGGTRRVRRKKKRQARPNGADEHEWN